MEIDIDTSQIGASTASNENNERIIRQIEAEISNKINLMNEKKSSSGILETISIKPNQMCLIKEEILTVYGVIQKTNEKMFDFKEGDNFIAIIYNEESIKTILAQKKKNLEVKIDLNESIVFKVSEVIMQSYIDTVVVISPFLINLYFAILSQFKYDKYTSILINTEHDFEFAVYKEIFNLLGYIEVEKYIEGETSNSYSHIFDFCSSMLDIASKVNTFNLLCQGGFYHAISVREKQNEKSNFQLIPYDFSIMTRKSISLCFANVSEMAKQKSSYGKLLNYFTDVTAKIIEKIDRWEFIKTSKDIFECSGDSIEEEKEGRYIKAIKN